MQKERLETWFFQKTFIFLNLIRSHLLSIHNADSFYPCSWRNETFCRGTAGVLIMLCEFTYGESPQTSSSYFFLIISNVPVHNVSVWFPSYLHIENTRLSKTRWTFNMNIIIKNNKISNIEKMWYKYMWWCLRAYMSAKKSLRVPWDDIKQADDFLVLNRLNAFFRHFEDTPKNWLSHFNQTSLLLMHYNCNSAWVFLIWWTYCSPQIIQGLVNFPSSSAQEAQA